ncbi:MAG: XdhC family protein [Geodermatophilaceae bacterium]|nr:XdhC family protein [Geodermatophilaceae bacterium]
MDILQTLSATREAGRRSVLVTVVAVEGEPPSYAGAKLAVADGQVLAGTLGCSEFDTAGIALAAELAGSGEAATLRRRMVFGHGQEQALELFAELHEPPPAVIVFGDNPIGRGVVELAKFLGRRAVLLHEDGLAAFEASPAGPADAVVLSDHDAQYVDAVLRQALAGPAFFVGMLGSHRHAPMVMQRLRDDGVPADHVDRLHSPCGLDIGSRGPAEIALSVVAEIVAVERGRTGGAMQMQLD